METKRVKLDRETFCCSICLDLLKDPVTIPCGHSYCMNCIKTHWDGEDEKEIYSCPQCRETFTPRPVLVKNTMLADLVEELKKSGLPAAPADHCYAGPDDVACDVCSGRKRKATKSCLICLVSYCDEHLQPHYQSSAFWRHKLVEPSKKLVFCCPELVVSRQNIQQRIQDREKNVKLLQQELDAINSSADKTVEDSEKILTEIITLTQKQISELKQQVRSQQETEESRVKELQEKLQQEITELTQKEAEMEMISLIEDQKKFRESYLRLSGVGESTDVSSIIIRPLRYFEDLTAALSEVKDEQQDILRKKWTNVSQTVTEVDVLLSDPDAEPKTRTGFLRYARDITLDPNTAFPELLLSEGNRKATLGKPQKYPDHPDRFDVWTQVLSTECLTGRCYIEVEYRGEVSLALAYKNIKRKGGMNYVGFGYNEKSWSLICEEGEYVFSYNYDYTSISGPLCSRLGVYLDHSAGILSFYSVSDTMKLLHRVQTTFTQPLHAGFCFGIDIGDTGEFCKLTKNDECESATTSGLLN
ncbi:tripartite motif-containing protein 16-like protein [Centropristis striata]|uniref:tripartite motif-containing protein 16-like protein n=1 Tax=Centropristis striata TaxID=184440 RepID=UPI0027DF2766|nr:tripartite motif-containing protein 16-like protein [Centropristis striata]